VTNVGSWCDIWLRDVSHVFIFGVHVVDVTRWVAAAILGKVAYLSTVKTGSFGVWSLVIGLSLDVCGVVVFRLGSVRVGIIALVLASVIWGPGPRQVHWYLDIVICGTQCIGRVILWPLLLLLLLLGPLLVLLGSSSPGSWSKLILVLPECVIESSWVGDSSPGSDEFDHLSSFDDIDRSGLVFVVSLWDWEFDDLIQYAWG
jgi:hypothetical protein